MFALENVNCFNTEFPNSIDQCSPTLRAQAPKVMGFEEMGGLSLNVFAEDPIGDFFDESPEFSLEKGEATVLYLADCDDHYNDCFDFIVDHETKISSTASQESRSINSDSSITKSIKKKAKTLCKSKKARLQRKVNTLALQKPPVSKSILEKTVFLTVNKSDRLSSFPSNFGFIYQENLENSQIKGTNKKDLSFTTNKLLKSTQQTLLNARLRMISASSRVYDLRDDLLDM